MAYADLFEYPLDRSEIHRYLIGEAASSGDVGTMLERDGALGAYLERTGDRFHLRGRASTIETRRAREAASADLWRAARAYGALVARLPLVRFVGVTGALAMSNAERRADIDLFVLTHPGRVWLCRLLVLAVVRLAALRGHRALPELPAEHRCARAARAQPLHRARDRADGPRPRDRVVREVHGREPLGARLPAQRAPAMSARSHRADDVLTRIATGLLASRLFAPLERWEMRRKIRRLTARAAREGGSLSFSEVECRGHFAAHDVRVLAAYAERAAQIEGQLE